MLIEPVAVTGASPTLPSVTAPVTVPLITDASALPLMVTVTIGTPESMAITNPPFLNG